MQEAAQRAGHAASEVMTPKGVEGVAQKVSNTAAEATLRAKHEAEQLAQKASNAVQEGTTRVGNAVQEANTRAVNANKPS